MLKFVLLSDVFGRFKIVCWYLLPLDIILLVAAKKMDFWESVIICIVVS